MSRGLRMAIGVAVGLILGGVSVASFAAASDFGRSMRLNAPSGSGARFTGAPTYDWADAPSGWGRMNDINKINIGGKSFDVTGGRLFSPQTLAKGAVSFARFGGPAWLGFMLAGLIWDEVNKRWLTPEEAGFEGAGYVVKAPLNTGSGYAISQSCVNAPREAALAAGVVGMGGATLQEAYDRVYSAMPSTLKCVNSSGGLVTMSKQAKGAPTTTPSVEYKFSSNWWYVGWSYDSVQACPEGQIRSATTGQCVFPGGEPADDVALEDAIYVELVARGMGSDLARRLIEAGYKPQVDGIEIDGPSSIPGDSTTTTTSGPAGQTTSTTNTTHNITYNTNTTNNTSTVTITNTTTTTTTGPDGTTTETTEETAPEGGETTPPEEPKPFCELYPTASACAELGETQDEELDEESVNVSWSQQGGAAGACPAPIQISVLGTQHAIQWTPICQVASGIRPIVIGLAWLSAALWLFLMARARA